MLLIHLLASALAAPPLRVGILGEFLVHPGVSVGVERPPDDDGLLVFGARGGGYVHPGHHTAVFAHGEGGLRVGREVHADLLVGAGIHHHWLPTRVVVRRDDGFARVIDGGRPTALATLGLRLTDADGRVRPFGRADVWWRGPVNGRVRTELVVALGAAFGGNR